MTTAMTIPVEEQVAELVKAKKELAELRAKLRDPVALAGYLYALLEDLEEARAKAA